MPCSGWQVLMVFELAVLPPGVMMHVSSTVSLHVVRALLSAVLRAHTYGRGSLRRESLVAQLPSLEGPHCEVRKCRCPRARPCPARVFGGSAALTGRGLTARWAKFRVPMPGHGE